MSKTFDPVINPHEKAKEGKRNEKGGQKNVLRDSLEERFEELTSDYASEGLIEFLESGMEADDEH